MDWTGVNGRVSFKGMNGNTPLPSVRPPLCLDPNPNLIPPVQRPAPPLRLLSSRRPRCVLFYRCRVPLAQYTHLDESDMRHLYFRVLDSSRLLRMKPPKLKGIAKQLHEDDPIATPKPRLLGETSASLYISVSVQIE